MRQGNRRPVAMVLPLRVLGALLALAVSVIHVVDQGGLPGTRTPAYVAILYWILEVAGVVTALLLLGGLVRIGWLLALGVAVGPILGYVLSRGSGLPDYGDDIGNWTETLGLVSLVVEGALLLLALPCFLALQRARRRRRLG